MSSNDPRRHYLQLCISHHKPHFIYNIFQMNSYNLPVIINPTSKNSKTHLKEIFSLLCFVCRIHIQTQTSLPFILSPSNPLCSPHPSSPLPPSIFSFAKSKIKNFIGFKIAGWLTFPQKQLTWIHEKKTWDLVSEGPVFESQKSP